MHGGSDVLRGKKGRKGSRGQGHSHPVLGRAVSEIQSWVGAELMPNHNGSLTWSAQRGEAAQCFATSKGEAEQGSPQHLADLWMASQGTKKGMVS